MERNVIACFLSSGIASKEDVFTKSKFKHNNQKQGGGGCKITFLLHQDEKAFKTYSVQHIHLRIGVVTINWYRKTWIISAYQLRMCKILPSNPEKIENHIQYPNYTYKTKVPNLTTG